MRYFDVEEKRGSLIGPYICKAQWLTANLAAMNATIAERRALQTAVEMNLSLLPIVLSLSRPAIKRRERALRAKENVHFRNVPLVFLSLFLHAAPVSFIRRAHTIRVFFVYRRGA